MNGKTQSSSAKVLLLDRDNTINVDEGYTFKRESLRLIPEAIHLLSIAKKLHIPCLVISNQSVIGRGIASLEEVSRFNRKLVSELESHGCCLDAVIFCPHVAEDDCACRKPQLLMFQRAFSMYPAATDFAYIGDAESDRVAARNSGIRFFDSANLGGYIEARNWLKE